MEKLQIQLKSLQKEEHALDVVSEELQARNRERDELNAQVKGSIFTDYQLRW